MSQPIRLERPVETCAWNVEATVARAQRRIELLPVLLRAQENRGTDPQDIAGHLLGEPKSRRVVGERLLHICRAHGLLEVRDRRYYLTESGQRAVETERIFVPEVGAWTIWASRDPLLPCPILRVEPWREPSAVEEVFGGQREKSRDRTFKALPSWLSEITGRELTPVSGGEAAIRIDEFRPTGEEVEPGTDLRLVWDTAEGSRKLQLRGWIRGDDIEAELPTPQIGVGVLRGVLLECAGRLGAWDASGSVLRATVADLTETELESMTCTVQIDEPEVPGLGRFEPTTLAGLPIAPRSEEEAAEWAFRRLLPRVREYATKVRYDRWAEEAVRPLSEFSPAVPERQELAEAIAGSIGDGERPSPIFWHLWAACDWSL